MHPDIARIVLAIDEGRAVLDLDICEFLERDLLSARRGDRNVRDLLRRVPVLFLEAHDEIELLFLLHHFCRNISPDGGLDQGVDVVDIETVAGNLGAIDLDVEAGLSEFLHQRHIADSAHILKDLLDRFAFRLQRIEVRPEHLDRQRTLETGLRLVHRVFRRLCVIEYDAGKRLRASC